MQRILFVCLGNICRSPLAEGIFQHLVEEAGESSRFHIDSAGTSAYHVGERADSRMRKTAKTHGIELLSRSRQVLSRDTQEFDYIFAMDGSNYRDLKRLMNNHSTAKLVLFREYDPLTQGPDDVPDPYYGGPQGFEDVYEIVYRTCKEILNDLQ